MFTVNQFEDDYCMLKYDAASEHSQVPWMPLQGTKIPLYWLGSRSALDNGACGRLSCTPTEDQTLLDSLFLAQWEDCAWKGFLRYDVTACELKVIDGRRNFVAQLNEGWNLNNFLKQNPFTSKCMKMHREWLLFGIASGEQTNPKIIHSATIPDGASLVIVNACYFANPLPVELMSVVAIHGGQKLEGLHIYEVKDYPVKAFLFIGNGNLKILIEVVVNICSWLQDQMVPYSMLISDCGTKMYLFPKRLMVGSSLSAWECGGYIVFKDRFEFDQATEEAVMERLGALSLDDECFSTVKQLCCSVASKLAT
ncbi:GDP-L-galactose phosphorylase 1-like isoform X4 [Macadamia integrifolia]|uniref:GDP-L-galactose phosphorylase 1-like isoform X4 n=1 Tax=Macadamia integrifolia TaxID=60698 RepID=UPI001C4ED302|nr:GDP-L-galactose phosphorylase 1-like isoform X4 [Macadamia integrifolia]